MPTLNEQLRSRDAVTIRSDSSFTDALESERASFRRERVRRAMAVMFATVVSLLASIGIAECAARIIVHFGRPPQFGDLEVDAKREVALGCSARPQPKLFFIGSSYTSRGVFADLISDKFRQRGLNLEACNLGVSGGIWTQDELYLVDEAMRAGAKAAAIVAEVQPAGFVLRPEIAQRFSDRLRNSYMAKAINVGVTTDPFAQIEAALHRYFYLIRYRSYLREKFFALRSLIFGVEDRNHSYSGPSVHSEISNRGWAPAYENATPERLKKSLDTRERYEIPQLLPADALSIEHPTYPGVQVEATYCRKNHTPLILLWLPIHPEYQKRLERYMQLSDDQICIAMNNLAQHEHAILIDLHRLNSPEFFADADHVNAAGAVHVTERLSAVLTSQPLSGLLESRSSLR